jgi:single-strand DNA-binding protein
MANLTGVFRIGRNAEIRYTAGGDSVANLSLAYNYGKKGADGSRPAQWVDGSLWGKRAESLAEYLVKGQQVFAVINDIHIEEFKKNDGSIGIKLTGSVGEIELVGGGKGGERTEKPAPKAEPKGGFDEMADDIPF